MASPAMLHCTLRRLVQLHAGGTRQTSRRPKPARFSFYKSMPSVTEADEATGAQHLPALFLAHGGGPLPLLGDPSHTALVKHWTSLSREMAALKPVIRAILLVSAHWEEARPTVTSYSSPPPLTYDYGGFPKEAYEITYPAAGDPQLALRVLELLRGAGIEGTTNTQRGLDHGAYVPLKIVFPKADVPVVVLSLISSLDPVAHLAMGRALAPLSGEGVLIVGSGMTFHNMDFFRGDGAKQRGKAQEFNYYLKQAVIAEPQQQETLLVGWQQAPYARFAHPREEHLLPLHVVAGAARCRPGSVIFDDTVLGAPLSSYQYV